MGAVYIFCGSYEIAGDRLETQSKYFYLPEAPCCFKSQWVNVIVHWEVLVTAKP